MDARAYVNPLPHALTLTGIVVGVATLGVALSLVDLDLPALRQPGRRRDPEEARMTRHLPVLVYLIPLLAGIAMPAVAVRRPRWCRPIALVGRAADEPSTAIANLVAVVTRRGDPLRLRRLGGPLGIEWVADAVASVVMVVVSLIAPVCLVYGGTVRLQAPAGREQAALRA